MLIADAVDLGSCGNPKCRALHIYFTDAAGKRLAVGGIHSDDIPSFIKAVQDIAYEIAATRDSQGAT